MFIIVIAHIPGNTWTLWIPARFGFSDATEIFVFCSGMASAIAFGATFAQGGWWSGTVRILFRVWQVYWAHLGAFFVIAALVAALTAGEVAGRDYVRQLNLGPFFDDPMTALPALLSLRYVPNYFDILPMYLVILALVPLVIALARVHVGLSALAVGALWLAANTNRIGLAAEPWSDRQWYFNPFGWQLLFFTGFGLMAGWLRPPPVDRRLVVLAALVVLASVPFAYFRILQAAPALLDAADSIAPLTLKTPFGPLRYLHFLAIAYLAWVAVGPGGSRLDHGRWLPRIVTVVRRVGQQSLAVFVTGLVLAQLLGVAIDLLGRDALTMAAVNLAGMALVIATAYSVAWIKSEPWRPSAPVRQLRAPPADLNDAPVDLALVAGAPRIGAGEGEPRERARRA